jgi:glutathione S-transferase
MTLTLYYAPVSCSLVPYLALSEAGADFDVQVVDFRRGTHMSPDYLRLNPKHKVPVLVVDGKPLTENVAIQLWIARQFPLAKLLPSDTWETYRAISLLAWCASGIHPHLTPNVLPQRYCDLPGSEESVRRCAHSLLRENYQIAEDALKDRDWFFDHFTLPDAYFFWCYRRGRQFNVDLSAFPNCQAHFDRVAARASTQRLFAFEAETLRGFEKTP